MTGDFRRVHLVGICGDGMAGLARLLWQGGAEVSGSDAQASGKLWEVAEWADVFLGHDPEHLPLGVDAVIFSSAVAPDNPELKAAETTALLPRLYALSQLLRDRTLVAVAGTHGKTTTTTWIAYLLRSCGIEPGHYVGGQIPGLPSATWGKGRFFVAEVDESDGRFVCLSPAVTVLTSVDGDHINNYSGFFGLTRAFATFLDRSQKIVACVDDPVVAELVRGRRHVTTFGLSVAADFRARGIWYQGERVIFDLWAFGRLCGPVEVPGPGLHNVRNALAALAAGYVLGLPLELLVENLASAPRPRRRLEVLEENGYLVVDDYAHHPTELAAGISALRRGWPGRRIIAVFQPHRYTRTALLSAQFGEVLSRADQVVVTEIYPAFEPPIPGVSGEIVADAIRRAGGKALFRHDLNEALETAAELIRPGDIVVAFGAGDIWRLSREMARSLSSGS
ncbi:MAG: UDP-N-acetylmuramate--L-alanine ligase [Candidatus Bipolaricaulota bacterium]|nr:UDP-N-acetylmuramate--L-alanine ligase [Candidatus Bipolaricaulota bacterium]MDW8126494.1 UDP-N-acetylmuramate--L-alanine ligase [Candidatus Bipolaricaulota bacterium]